MESDNICLMSNFGTWLQTELDLRRMKPIELARLAHLDAGAISRIIKGYRKPSPETLEAIASALKIPSVIIYRAAGLLVSTDEKKLKDEDSPLDGQIKRLIQSLPTEEDKADVLAYIELRHRLAEERGRYETRSRTKPAKP